MFDIVDVKSLTTLKNFIKFSRNNAEESITFVKIPRFDTSTLQKLKSVVWTASSVQLAS